MVYRGWQVQDMKQPLSKNVDDALQNYIQKHGLPTKILLEVSDQLPEVFLPEGMNIVIKSVRIPKNIIFVGEME